VTGPILPMTAARFLLYHKHSISARTLFLRFPGDTVLAPGALPFLAAPLDAGPEEDSLPHPASLARQLEASLQLAAHTVEIDPEFREFVEIPGGAVAVHLARLTSLDPPRELFARRGARFCAITELRGGHPAEMDLLRKAYEQVLGG